MEFLTFLLSGLVAPVLCIYWPDSRVRVYLSFAASSISHVQSKSLRLVRFAKLALIVGLVSLAYTEAQKVKGKKENTNSIEKE